MSQGSLTVSKEEQRFTAQWHHRVFSKISFFGPKAAVSRPAAHTLSKKLAAALPMNYCAGETYLETTAGN